MTSWAERVCLVVRVVSLTEKGPTSGPGVRLQVAPQMCFIWTISFTCFSCMDPMSPSPSSNSTRSESQKVVEPSFTWKAMFFPPYLHAVLKND
ncbi:Os02g0639550, partial [Oryza sativa Japonica Group]